MNQIFFGPNTASHLKPGRRRILLTSRSGQLGGMEMRLAAEAQFLSQSDWECILAPSQFEGRDRWLRGLLRDHPGLQYLDFQPPPFFEEWSNRHINLVRARLRWPRLLRRARLDLAHVFYAWSHEGGSRLSLLREAGVPCVLSIHNAFPLSDFTPWHARITAESFKAVRGLYAVSESALGHFLALYGRYVPEHAHVAAIPNYVDVHRFVPSIDARREVRSELDIHDDVPLIGSVGRLDVQKQPFHVLDVFERVWTTKRNSHLLFCGAGPLEKAVKEAVAGRPWAAQVRFLGFRGDVHRIYPALDVHLLLSQQEGFGISTVEAMACGVPVVATDVPGTRDILRNRDCGVLVPFNDSQTASEAVLAILESDARQLTLGCNGVKIAAHTYSKEIWSSRLFDFYGNVQSVVNR